MKHGYHANIETLTKANTDFRHVLYTGRHAQLVLMCLAPAEDIGMETHPDNDQFFRFESGTGKVVIDETEYSVTDGDCIIIPAGAKHNVTNVSSTEPLKLYTLYSPPHHEDGIVRATKSEATASAPEYTGNPTE